MSGTLKEFRKQEWPLYLTYNEIQGVEISIRDLKKSGEDPKVLKVLENYHKMSRLSHYDMSFHSLKTGIFYESSEYYKRSREAVFGKQYDFDNIIKKYEKEGWLSVLEEELKGLGLVLSRQKDRDHSSSKKVKSKILKGLAKEEGIKL